MTGPQARPRLGIRPLPGLLLAAVLVACAGPATPSPSASGTAVTASPSADASQGPIGEVIAAPGSDSSVYAPNPGALVVAIDAGHGGCLDWGVPDPRQRGVPYSEKSMTLAIAQQLQAMLEAQGVTVVMTRDDDVALAGDDYPDLGCHGPPWRDVNGDGESGFDPEGAIRTRDELQARLDLANLVRADALVSIHINSLTENGVVFDIAATETFYTDETPWGDGVTAPLAQAIQDGVVDELDGVADYDRQDRGIQAHNLFIVAPPLLETTPERPDPRKQPTRGALMPSVLTEVGSITHRAEQDLLASTSGQRAAAQGIFAALQGMLANRALGVAYQVPALEPMPGTLPVAQAGDGPILWAPRRARRPADHPAHQHRERSVAGGRHPGGWLGRERRAVPARAAGGPRAAAGPGVAGARTRRIGRRGGQRAGSRIGCARPGLDHAGRWRHGLDRHGDSGPAGGRRRLDRLTLAQGGCYHRGCQISNRQLSPARGLERDQAMPSNNAGERLYCLIRGSGAG